MTHDKFIELLNLYLDGDLPPAEAASLEREIHGNVDRRRIYRQYCQMQRACADLSERFREEASPAAQFRSGAVVNIPQRTRGDWFRSIALVASGAAAAWVVFVALRLSVPEDSGSNLVQSPAAPSAVTVVAAVPQPQPGTTTVALSSPSLFDNPWATGQRATQRMVSLNRIMPAGDSLMLSVPELKLPPGTENMQIDLQPYGVAPGKMLRIDEIETAAFQFSQ